MPELSTPPLPNKATRRELLPDHIILLGWRGSISHGLYQSKPTEDKDLLGIYVEELNDYFSIEKNRKRTRQNFSGQWDAVSHEISKFVNMALGFNPNIINLLWLPDELIIEEATTGKMLRANRDYFISKKQAYSSFRGYAKSQVESFKKARDNIDDIRRLQKISNNICKQKGQKRLDELDNGNYVNKDHLSETEEEYVELTDKYYSGYMGKKRKDKVLKFGYDPKAASHAIRLLKMGREFLETGHLNIVRDDSEQLIAIKNGEWEFGAVIEKSNQLLEKLNNAYKHSSLPEKPKRNEAGQLLARIIKTYHDIN